MLKRLKENKIDEVITTITKKAATKRATKKLVNDYADSSVEIKVNTNKKSVLFASSECQPFMATGGLADVVGSLPKELVKQNPELDVRVVLPLYSEIKAEYKEKFLFVKKFNVKLAWRNIYCGLYEYKSDGVIFYFIDNEYYFKRQGLYNHYDDGERFSYFSKAVVTMLNELKFFPNVLHCNDWQTALVPAYLKQTKDAKFLNIKTIYTIHNIEYQGIYNNWCYGDVFGLDQEFYNNFAFNDVINLSKGAITYSDMVTTVSPTYMEEIKMPLASFGLDKIMVQNEHKLLGIVNGIDYDYYNPLTDKNVYKNYSIDTYKDKVYNKTMLQKELGLPLSENVPMMSIVSRLVKTKGLDIVLESIEEILQNNNIQFVVLGAGDKNYEKKLVELEKKYANQVRAIVGFYSNEWARRIMAASDMFLMPSINEPCGLSQMIASRYGVVPLVREVGGLKDTIKDFGNPDGGNGYTFSNYSASDLGYSIKRMINDYKDKELWTKYIKTVMSKDFSWGYSAKQYIEMYNKLF